MNFDTNILKRSAYFGSIATVLLFLLVLTPSNCEIDVETSSRQSSTPTKCKAPTDLPSQNSCPDGAAGKNRFFYDDTAGRCDSYTACDGSTLEGTFESVLHCIIACDPFGSGDRLHLDTSHELDCPKPEFNSKTSENPYRTSSKELEEAVGSTEASAAFAKQKGDSAIAADWINDENGWTILHHAASTGQVDVAKQLVKVLNASLLTMTNNLETPLHLAVKEDKFEVARILVELAKKQDRGKNEHPSVLTAMVNAGDKCGFTPLHYAAFYGSVEMCELLHANRADPMARSATGKMPIHLARNMEQVAYLVSVEDMEDIEALEPFISSVDADGRTAYFYAGNRQDDMMLAAHNVDLGANRDHRDRYGMPALLYAISTDNLNFSVYTTDDMSREDAVEMNCCGAGRTAAHFAARYGSANTIGYYLAKRDLFKIDVSGKDWMGQSPLCLAQQQEHASVAILLIQNGAILQERSVCYDAFAEAVGIDKKTALHDAVAAVQLDVVELLLSKGAPTSARDKATGQTALHFASVRCSSTSVEIAKRLIEASFVDSLGKGSGAVSWSLIDAEDNQGETALELAVKTNCVDMVLLFLSPKFSANCSRLNRDGLSALHLASHVPGNGSLAKAMVATGKCAFEQLDACGNKVAETQTLAPISCGNPRQVDNGVISFHHTCIKTKATLTCDDGFNLIGPSFIECGADGQWSIPGKCENAALCLAFPSLSNMTFWGTLPVQSGSSRNISCQGHTLVLVGSGEIRCDRDGRWVVKGHCEEGCSEPPVLKNGVVCCPDRTSKIGSRYKINCNNGFKLCGSENVQCQTDGNWKVSGHCVENSGCCDLPYLEHGNISLGLSVVGSIRVATCEPGFGLNATRLVQCMDDGNWRLLSFCKKVQYNEQLVEAAGSGSVGDVEKLLLEDADVNTKRAGDGSTAVTAAVYHNAVDIVRLLVDRGANPNIKPSDEKFTPLIYASEWGYVDVIRLLIDGGADLNIRKTNDFNRTALIMATKNNQREAVRLLVDSGADVNLKDDINDTALAWAAHFNYADIAQLLLTKHADVNSRANNGWTALMIAAASNSEETAKLLIEHGADVNVRNKDGRTALYYATEKGFSSMADLLEENRAYN